MLVGEIMLAFAIESHSEVVQLGNLHAGVQLVQAWLEAKRRTYKMMSSTAFPKLTLSKLAQVSPKLLATASVA